MSQNLAASHNNPQLRVESTKGRVTSKTAPARLEGLDDETITEQNNVLAKVNQVHSLVLNLKPLF